MQYDCTALIIEVTVGDRQSAYKSQILGDRQSRDSGRSRL